MDVDFCVSALKEALRRYGRPEIFNTDQGSQFTSTAFTGLLKTKGIKISMDGRGRCKDNVYIERLWRFLKYEEVRCIYTPVKPAGKPGPGQVPGSGFTILNAHTAA